MNEDNLIEIDFVKSRYSVQEIDDAIGRVSQLSSQLAQLQQQLYNITNNVIPGINNSISLINNEIADINLYISNVVRSNDIEYIVKTTQENYDLIEPDEHTMYAFV